ncbi:MAG: GTP 3',8-cyclase MoaA [Synergistetes bacterium]|nr:GTP 3',8-cyclase MoaA [Synergistota bacterium]
MTDGFGRTINYLRVSVTDRCNLRCRYCMPPGGIELIPHEEILRYEEIVRILGSAISVGLGRVRFTGGEPLLRKGFIPFLRKVREHFPRLTVSLTTNGILLSRFVEDLVSLELDSINVSLDTLIPERYKYITRLGDFKSVWSGILRALDKDLTVKINVVAIKGFNDDEFVDFVELTRNLNVIVRFIEFMPLGGGLWCEGSFISIDEIKKSIERKYSITPANLKMGGGPASYFRLPWGGLVGFIGAVSHHFCDKCNRLRLTADGRLKTCLFGGPEFDIKKALREGASEEDIASLIRRAILSKPRGWFVLKGEDREIMSRIGG